MVIARPNFYKALLEDDRIRVKIGDETLTKRLAGLRLLFKSKPLPPRNYEFRVYRISVGRRRVSPEETSLLRNVRHETPT